MAKSPLSKRLARKKESLGETGESASDPRAVVSAKLKDAPKSTVIEELRRKMEELERRLPAKRVDSSGLSRMVEDPQPLAGELVQTGAGPVRVSTVRYRPGTLHGVHPADGFLETGAGLAELVGDRSLRDLGRAGALFLDTETTGLSGGTGTIAFLVGLGWFEEDGAFLLEQLFCEDPSQEPAQLELLAARLAKAEFLVTFNGKAFDMPLLNTRFIMNKMKNPGYALPHLDLLQPARKVFKRRLSDRSLTALEEAVLGFVREDDIPGHAIPAAYRRFLRTGYTEDMAAVMRHNAWDLIALGALGGVLEHMYVHPEEAAHPADNIGMALAAMDAGSNDTAEGHLKNALAGDHLPCRCEALHLEAREARRSRDFTAARDAWLSIVAVDEGDEVAHLALAKHYEHREKDFERARTHAVAARELEGREAHEKRLARIIRKEGRS